MAVRGLAQLGGSIIYNIMLPLIHPSIHPPTHHIHNIIIQKKKDIKKQSQLQNSNPRTANVPLVRFDYDTTLIPRAA